MEYTRPDGATTEGPLVLKDEASLCGLLLCRLPSDPGPIGEALSDAMRRAHQYASELGFARVVRPAP